MRERLKKIINFVSHNVWVKIIVGAATLALVVFVAVNELESFDIGRMLQIASELPWYLFALLCVSGLIAVFMGIGMDFAVAKGLDYGVSTRDILLAGFVGCAFNNFISLAGTAGMGTRSLLLGMRGVPPEKHGRGGFYIMLAQLTGLGALSGLCLLFVLIFLPDYRQWYNILVLALLPLYLPVYFFMDRLPILKNKLPADGREAASKLRPRMFLGSLAHWTGAMLFFLACCMFVGCGVPVDRLCVAFLFSMVIGTISIVPGGIGVFDVAAALMLENAGAEQNVALTAVLLFRFFYYIAPWFLSLLPLGGSILHARIKKSRK